MLPGHRRPTLVEIKDISREDGSQVMVKKLRWSSHMVYMVWRPSLQEFPRPTRLVSPPSPKCKGTVGYHAIKDMSPASILALGKYCFVRKSSSTISCTDFPSNDSAYRGGKAECLDKPVWVGKASIHVWKIQQFLSAKCPISHVSCTVIRIFL